MCGRYGRVAPRRELIARLGVAESEDAPGSRDESYTRYNQPPGEFPPVGISTLDDRGTIEVADVFWGFIPSWADKASFAKINARAETAHAKPYWRKAFHQRRCVVAADWWYEWLRDGDSKQPHAIRPVSGAPFFFAGVWSLAKNLPATNKASGQRTFAILTTEAAPSIAHIHHRMPIALTDEAARGWLEGGDDTDELHRRLAQGRYNDYESWPVSTLVNSPKNDNSKLLEPV